jgi:hypothetical protein
MYQKVLPTMAGQSCKIVGGQHTQSSEYPEASHDPSLFNLVGGMYQANGLEGYSSDFSFLTQGPGWINRMVRAAQAAKSKDIIPIIFQAWGGLGTEDTYHHTKINSDAVQSKIDILVVRTGEIIEVLSQLDEGYTTNSDSPRGKYSPPVLHVLFLLVALVACNMACHKRLLITLLRRLIVFRQSLNNQ